MLPLHVNVVLSGGRRCCTWFLSLCAAIVNLCSSGNSRIVQQVFQRHFKGVFA